MNDDEACALGGRCINAIGGWRPGMFMKSDGEGCVDYYLPSFRESHGRDDVGVWVAGTETDDVWRPGRLAWRLYDGYGTCVALCRCLWVDLRNPASRGVVLDVVRERHGRPGAYAAPVNVLGHAEARLLSGPRKGRKVGPDGWAVYGLGLDVLVVGASEAEALVSALEIAP